MSLLHKGSLMAVLHCIAYTGFSQGDTTGKRMPDSARFNQLQEMIVTGSRTLQKRTEAPIAISTITARTIADTKATQLDQVLNKVPGVFMVDLTPLKGLKLVAAARYDFYHYKFRNYLPSSSSTGASNTKNDFNRVTPKVGATYNYKTIGFYANYSQGYVPPQVTELYNGLKVPYLKPQTFFNYEVGGWLSLLQNKLYKHHFMDWGGKTVRDASTLFWAFIQIAMVVVGLILWFRYRRR